jgi:fatty-acyl-CoA synthase
MLPMWNCITELQELALCHPINIRLSGQQTEYIINNSEDRVIFVDATLVPL